MSSVLQRRQQLLGDATLFYEDPIQIVKGDGVLLYDEKGKQYIDMYNNVPCVGHANPVVVEAMAKQMSTLNVHSRYLHEGILNYAERLLGLHHADLENIIFACTGTEASEIALMTARIATRGRGIICTDATYHGNSSEVIKMAIAASLGEPANAEFRAIPFPQKYRPLQQGLDEEALCELYLDKIRQAIADFEGNKIPFAGMFVCSIFANEGLPDIPGSFMAKATDIVQPMKFRLAFVARVISGAMKPPTLSQISSVWANQWATGYPYQRWLQVLIMSHRFAKQRATSIRSPPVHYKLPLAWQCSMKFRIAICCDKVLLLVHICAMHLNAYKQTIRAWVMSVVAASSQA